MLRNRWPASIGIGGRLRPESAAGIERNMQRIAEIDKIQSIEHYKRDDDRIGLLVDVKETNRIERTKIIIDLRRGQPSVHQVYDALYDIGKDCDIRIIVHTNEDDERVSLQPIPMQY